MEVACEFDFETNCDGLDKYKCEVTVSDDVNAIELFAISSKNDVSNLKKLSDITVLRNVYEKFSSLDFIFLLSTLHKQ